MAEDLKTQNEMERQFYLGKTDKVPGSDKTLKDLKAEYQAQVAKDAKAKEDRRKKYLDGLAKTQDVEPRTSLVTFGVLAEINPPKASDLVSIATPEDNLVIAGQKAADVKPPSGSGSTNGPSTSGPAGGRSGT
jgi:hypothetical protein